MINTELGGPYDEDSTSYLEPADPLNARLLQLTTLMDLGYPVAIQTVPASQVPDDFYEDEAIAFDASRWSTWFRPIVDSQFEEYFEFLGDAGSVIWSDDTKLQARMEHHVAQVANFVDIAEPSVIATHMPARDAYGQPSPLYLSDGTRASDELLGSCLVAAVERKLRQTDAGVPDRGYVELNSTTLGLYDDMCHSGIIAIDPEKMGGLVYDYYRLAEEINPDFRSFKGASPTTNPDKL